MTSYDSNQLQAIQAVVDRVSSYQDTAPDRTIDTELKDGFAESGVEVGDDDVAKLVAAIDADAGDVAASEVLA